MLIRAEVLGHSQDALLDVITESQTWFAGVETRSQVFILPQITFGRSRYTVEQDLSQWGPKMQR